MHQIDVACQRMCLGDCGTAIAFICGSLPRAALPQSGYAVLADMATDLCAWQCVPDAMLRPQLTVGKHMPQAVLAAALEALAHMVLQVLQALTRPFFYSCAG